MRIIKEVPVWVIDWVNTIFTLKNDIEFIDDIFLDWAIYTSYTLKWNILTLVDAPLVSLFIDYETKENTIYEKISTQITLGDIVSEVYNLTGQTPNSTNFNRNRIVRMINSVSSKIWKWRVVNLLNPNQIFRNNILDFASWVVSFRIRWLWVLNKNLEINDSEASWDFSELDLAWMIKIWWDFLVYDYNSKKILSWLEGQTIKYFPWEKLKQIYPLPENFFEISEIFEKNFFKNYEIINHKWKYFIDFSWFKQNDLITIKYKKKYINLENDSDLCLFPNSYWIDVIANLVAWELLFQRNMPTAQNLLSEWYNYLSMMYQEFEKNKNPIKNFLRPNFRKWKI